MSSAAKGLCVAKETVVVSSSSNKTDSSSNNKTSKIKKVYLCFMNSLFCYSIENFDAKIALINPFETIVHCGNDQQ